MPEAGEEYRFRLLRNAVREQEIRSAFGALRASGIEPVLLKGWSVARHYPDSILRSLGDIDLLIPDGCLDAAKQAMREHVPINIDWHQLSDLQGEFLQVESVFERSELVALGDAQVRVLCHEDNLHFVAIHMLRHGGWSPVWLKDVEVLVEKRPSGFDWDVCLGRDTTRAAWVLSAMVLSRNFIGTDLCGTPAERYQVSSWLEAAMRKARKKTNPADNQPPESIWSAIAHPWRLPNGLRQRWPNPIAAAVMTGARFEARSPLAHRMNYCARMTLNFLARTRPFSEKGVTAES